MLCNHVRFRFKWLLHFMLLVNFSVFVRINLLKLTCNRKIFVHFDWEIMLVCVLPSISSTFYAHVFHKKCRHQQLQSCVLGLKFFWRQNIGAKCAHKMLMKSTPKKSVQSNSVITNISWPNKLVRYNRITGLISIRTKMPFETEYVVRNNRGSFLPGRFVSKK